MSRLVAAVIFCLAVAAHGAETRPPALAAVGIDQRLDEQLPLDVTFRDGLARRHRGEDEQESGDDERDVERKDPAPRKLVDDRASCERTGDCR